MNHRGGWALIKSTWASWMQYRSFFFVLAFGWMVPPLVAMFVWLTAAGEGSISGITRSEFVTYYLVLMLVNQLTYSQANWTLGDMIREGILNHWLLRPLAPVYHVLASEVAGKIVYLLFTVPFVLLLALILKPVFNLNFLNGLLFLLSLIFAWALRFLWGFWLASLAFWSTRADAFLALQDSLVFIFSGMVAPLAILPPVLKTIAFILPFRYMVAFPVEIFTRQLSASEILVGLFIQFAWLTLAAALSLGLWRSGVKRYSAVGG